MDTITHAALGACLGEVLGNKKIGKHALTLGAVAQLIPDIDVLFSLSLDPSENVLAHRGFTHSFVFGMLATVLFAWLFKRKWGGAHSFNFWLIFFGVQIFVHILLDGFNAYGTAWFEPFSHYRVSFNTLFVADPLFSISVGVSALVLIFLRTDHQKRTHWAFAGILVSLVYLTYGLINKAKIDSDVTAAMECQQIPTDNYFTTPTPFNTLLWFVVATTDNGSYVGYRSVFDKSDRVDFQFFSRQDSLLSLAISQDDVHRLKRFSQGHYTVELAGDTLIFNDLRFGQMIGWKNPREGFVFHYYLRPALDNRMVLQRGRFDNWDIDATNALMERIKGID